MPFLFNQWVFLKFSVLSTRNYAKDPLVKKGRQKLKIGLQQIFGIGLVFIFLWFRNLNSEYLNGNLLPTAEILSKTVQQSLLQWNIKNALKQKLDIRLINLRICRYYLEKELLKLKKMIVYLHTNSDNVKYPSDFQKLNLLLP